MSDEVTMKILARIEASCASRGLDGGDGLVRYVEHGIIPGDFLTSLLEDRLVRAAGYADHHNLPRLHMWADILYNYVPAGARGSPEKVREWAKIGGLRGMAAHDAEIATSMRGDGR